MQGWLQTGLRPWDMGLEFCILSARVPYWKAASPTHGDRAALTPCWGLLAFRLPCVSLETLIQLRMENVIRVIAERLDRNGQNDLQHLPFAVAGR